jgi:hypothetical protein
MRRPTSESRAYGRYAGGLRPPLDTDALPARPKTGGEPEEKDQLSRYRDLSGPAPSGMTQPRYFFTVLRSSPKLSAISLCERPAS